MARLSLAGPPRLPVETSTLWVDKNPSEQTDFLSVWGPILRPCYCLILSFGSCLAGAVGTAHGLSYSKQIRVAELGLLKGRRK